MTESKRKILLIENQQFQFDTIIGFLKDYSVYPSKGEEYIKFIDNVRVWVNEEYSSEYRDIALAYINKYVCENQIELIIMDYVLGGAHHCLKGVDLARKINEALVYSISVLFLSKTEQNDKNRIIKFDEYKKKFINTTWVHKGYFGDEILKGEYFKEKVIPEIISLFGKGLSIKIIEKLEEKKPRINSASKEIHREIFSSTETIIQRIKAEEFEIKEDILDNLSKDYLDSMYLELLNSYIK